MHCGWAIQKAKTGLPNATGDTNSGPSNATISAIEKFIASITGDGNLQSAFSGLQSDFKNLFHVHSVTELITTGLDVLLDILETLVLGLVAVGGAFMAALLDIVEKTIDIFMGLLNAELNIPVLSWLYRLLFGQPLTALNAITLIAAIPVTMIYRVSPGQLPVREIGQPKHTVCRGARHRSDNDPSRNLPSPAGVDYRHRSRHSGYSRRHESVRPRKRTCS